MIFSKKSSQIKKFSNKKDNIAIIGEPGCGKVLVLKSILTNLVFSNKRVLVLEAFSESEYKKITDSLGGNYLIYTNTNTINYNRKLTTISFPIKISDCVNIPTIELILGIINDAENNGIEVVLIDGALNYLKKCKRLIDNIHSQLIINTEFDSDLLNKENSINFKNLFTTVFLMGLDNYNINYDYLSLLSLYNIDKLVSEYFKTIQPQQHFKNIVFQDGRILEKELKLTNRENAIVKLLDEG